jgi:ATP-binding cassette subfamily F protein uup
LASTSKSGKLVFELDNIGYAFENKLIVKGFSSQVIRGDRIALVGPNGCGKSTLLKLLLGQLTAQEGEVKGGTKLEVAYFDQHRTALDLDKTVQENVGDGKDDVIHNGRSRHVLGYLQDFLFSPKRARTPVRALSGGEKNRLLLAKLFLKPNNLLILDEPTNDLDVETLELLESLVHEYKGTLLLVSHDREFINNTVTSSWWFGDNGQIDPYVGGFDDAIHQGAVLFDPEAKKPKEASVVIAAEPAVTEEVSTPKKLSFKLQRELDDLPAKMEQLEQAIEVVQKTISEPDFFSQSNEQTQPVYQQLSELEAKLELALERWDELESMSN